MHNKEHWPEKYIRNQEEDLKTSFDQIFALIKKEYTKHIYEVFYDNYEIRLEFGDIVIPEVTLISDKNPIKSINPKKSLSIEDKEKINDIYIKQMVSIEEYKDLIKKYLDKVFEDAGWRDIDSYFEYDMWWLEVSKELKNKIIEYKWKKEIYQKVKDIYTQKTEYQKLYEEFLLSHPIDINNYNIPTWIKNQINIYEKQFAELWDLQIWIDEHNTYFVSIANLYIWWFHSVMSWDILPNLILIYYSKLKRYFNEQYKIWIRNKNTMTYYKMSKKWNIYIKRIEENKKFYKDLNI